VDKPWDKPTFRFSDGKLVTRGRARFEFARLSDTGVVHTVDAVIVRWNFMGGTREKSDVTWMMLCGPQTRQPIRVTRPMLYGRLCSRCENRRIRIRESSVTENGEAR
jgi:hypothetical protein